MPVVSASPAAGFVDPVTGLKPQGVIDWTPIAPTAAEIGVLVALPDAFVDDASFPVWASVKAEIVKSFVRVFEEAALYGIDAPAGWPVDGLTAPAFADPATGEDALGALDAAMSSLEGRGVEPTGILGGAALRAALRQAQVVVLQPFTEAPAQVWGVPITFSTHWDDSLGLALVGGFEDVLVGLRRDLSWLISDTAVISDAAGKVILNAYQADNSIMRCYMRVALTTAQPLGPDGTQVKTLALATVTPPLPLAASTKKASA